MLRIANGLMACRGVGCVSEARSQLLNDATADKTQQTIGIERK